MMKLERCQRAKEFHEKGLNCGQAVLLAFTDVTGLTEQQSMAVAGVVNAAAVVLGTAYPATLENGPDGKKRSTQLTQDFQRRFTERFRKLDCHDLLAEKDIEGTPTAQELGVTQHCRLLVVSGVELLSDMLDELEAR